MILERQKAELDEARKDAMQQVKQSQDEINILREMFANARNATQDQVQDQSSDASTI